MLTSETKHHIDAARQVLVGVVPNPTSQIDQITNALVYKFMDDMDQAAIKAGGKPSFFTGALERFAWTRLMDSRIGNQERMNLYQEALIKFSEAKQLPQLFREIFKSAFLPYRSPEVLGLFLKEIAYFDYSHSEELGNAYEYLLSIMSSQGDAGQFRTPRHIIDFIVAAVNPTKDDRVLDPACGTAGFLISAYKHILAQHDGKSEDGAPNKEKPLTPDERRSLMNNFEGYDIDPGMGRIAQVNMYLHQFKNPKIYNYDTLSSDDHWGDKFDVILANPPFMSPKGGVSTHNKFSIESSRSEVLFVDYIMHHLRPRGRAGVIVPEGIIFQSGKGHTQLRKNLLADGLWAVVSLPSGVFNPYAGVKTSVLLFDNELAKRSSEMVFVKVTNDGYDLGATKRPITKNDLPQALEILKAWKEGKTKESQLAVYVEKAKIAESGDFNLSVDRYRIATDYSNAKWPMVELGEVCSLEYGDSLPEKKRKSGPYPVIGSNGIVGSHESFIVEGPAIIVGRKGSAGEVTWIEQNCFPIDTTYFVKIANNKTDRRFLYYVLVSLELQKYKGGGAVPGLNRNDAYRLKIPLPPLEIQQQIVEELDGYQKLISGARQVVENWKLRIEVEEEWERVKLGEVTEILNGYAFKSENYVDVGIRVIRITNVQKGDIVDDNPKFYPLKSAEPVEKFKLHEDDLLISLTGNVGRVGLLPKALLPAALNQRVACLRMNEKRVERKFLFFWLNQDSFENDCVASSSGVAQKNLSTVWLSKYEIPLPPLAFQKQIVERIEAERALADGNKKLIEMYEQKIKETLAKLWKE